VLHTYDLPDGLGHRAMVEMGPFRGA